MGRPENKLNSDSGEGNLLKWGYMMRIYCNFYKKEVDTTNECGVCLVNPTNIRNCEYVEEIIESDNGNY